LSNVSALTQSGSTVGLLKLVNCKLHPSAVMQVPFQYTANLELLGSSSGALPRTESYQIQGVVSTERTIVRTGGADDGNPFSHKFAVPAALSRPNGLDGWEGAIWNDIVGVPRTLTLQCVTDGVTLKNTELVFEVEYLGSSDVPIATMLTNEPSILNAGANLAASTAVWNATGLVTPIRQQIAHTFTPQLPGLIRWRVHLYRGNTTAYVDPKADLT
jgi:hypothetical protein